MRVRADREAGRDGQAGGGVDGDRDAAALVRAGGGAAGHGESAATAHRAKCDAKAVAADRPTVATARRPARTAESAPYHEAQLER